jgi:hypothetical protein
MSNFETATEHQARIRSSRINVMQDSEPEVAPFSTIVTPAPGLHRGNASAYFEGGDIAAAALATIMMLAPLTAYAVGMGA